MPKYTYTMLLLHFHSSDPISKNSRYISSQNWQKCKPKFVEPRVFEGKNLISSRFRAPNKRTATTKSSQLMPLPCIHLIMLRLAIQLLCIAWATIDIRARSFRHQRRIRLVIASILALVGSVDVTSCDRAGGVGRKFGGCCAALAAAHVEDKTDDESDAGEATDNATDYAADDGGFLDGIGCACVGGTWGRC